jgi:hypothetical protein
MQSVPITTNVVSSGTALANARSKNIPLTDEILKEKAKHFDDETGVTDFKYSNGWLQRFKARHGISSHVSVFYGRMVTFGKTVLFRLY